MEDWWDSVVNLGQDALVWLLGLATHGGTYRDKPPRVGAGKTSNVRVEVGKANRYAQSKGLNFDWRNGYQRLQGVEVTGPGNKAGRMLTKAKSGGLMQFTTPVGIGIFHSIIGDDDFRKHLERALGVGQGEEGDPFFGPHDASPIQFKSKRTDDADVLQVTATLDCVRCKQQVEHSYPLRPFANPSHAEAPFSLVAFVCPKCNLTMGHSRGQPWRPPHIVD